MRALGTFVFVSLMVVVGLAQFYNFAFLRARANNLGAFNITGLTGGSDVTADAWLVNTTDPSVNFQSSSGATSYDVQVRDAAGTTTLCSVTGAAGSSVALSSCGLVNGGSYRAYVTAKQGGSSKAADNDGYSFSVDTTTPTTNTITGLTGGSDAVADIWLVGTLFPTVNWNAFTGAASYEVTIRDSAGTTVVCATQTTTSTSYNFAACLLTAGVDYRAYVTAKSASGQNTTAASNTGYAFSVDNTAPGSFTISGITGGTDVLVDTYLANGSEPTVNFGSASNVYRYDVVIKDAAGSTTICSALNQTASPVGVTGCSLSNGVTYRAYVQAKSISTYLTTNASNDGFSFTVGAPPAGSPGNFSITGATGGTDVTADSWLTNGTTVTANWQASAGAQNYSVTIRNSADTADVCATQVTTSTIYTFSGCTLVNGTSYLIKVTANNAPSTPIDALNNGFVFQVITPAPNTFTISGVKGPSGGSDTLLDNYLLDGVLASVTWTTATGATNYDVTIRNAANTADVCATVNTASTSYTFSTCTLTAGTSYLLQVVAKNASASTPALNGPFSFYVAGSVNFCPTGSSTAPALVIYDSGGPSGNYSGNQNCNFTISPTEVPSQIVLKFAAFSAKDAADILRVYNGTTTAGSLLGTYSDGNNSSLPSDRTATSGNMHLTWVTGGTQHDSGYHLTYRSVFAAAGAFTVTGVSGGSDVTADELLSDNSSGVTVSWGASSGASSYDVVIRNSANTNDICEKINTTSTSYTFSTCTLNLGAVYIAVVRARNGNGVLTAATNSPFSFTYDNRPRTFMISGLTGDSDVTVDSLLEGGLTPTLNWEASLQQTSYDVAIFESDGFTVKCAKTNVSGASTSHAFTGCTLNASTFYLAEVIAKNANGSTAASNNAFMFYTGTALWNPLSLTSVPSARQEHTAVWTGSEMIVWGGWNGYGYFSSGARYNPSTDSWTATSTGTDVPAVRSQHTAVWTGSEMIVWGGWSGNIVFNNGARYNPSADSWTTISVSGAPLGRYAHTAIWSGTEMIVWGGYNGYGYFSSGARYNPSTDTWINSFNLGYLEGRSDHTAVWTGSEMIVWGGLTAGAVVNSGGRYDPATGSWSLVSAGANVPSERRYHRAVWTGSEMIVWGGSNGSSGLITGGRYNPGTNTWTATSTGTNVPSGRSQHTAVWTGSEMIVWGGGSDNTGGRYDPSTDTWTATSTTNAPSSRYLHTAVWTNTEMIIWGGRSGSTYYNTGARYNPSTDTWTATGTGTNVPSARSNHVAVWTGSEMIVWGGWAGSAEFNTGGKYDPATDAWSLVETSSAPVSRKDHTAVWTGTSMIIYGGSTGSGDLSGSATSYDPVANVWTAILDGSSGRSRHTAVWTGTEMIVWGGYQQAFSAYLKTGKRYNPSTDSWGNILEPIRLPSARFQHRAVWTGTEMIIWGGLVTGTPTNTGSRYNPSTDSWTASTTTTGAPTPRSRHTAVWTGTEMIIWGGLSEMVTNTGGRYNPSSNSWIATSTGMSVPLARMQHTAIWTGDEMIIWGGSTSGSFLSSGASYKPATDSWTPTFGGATAPSARYLHTAIWTGTHMIIWGGTNGSALDTGAAYLVP